MMNLGSNFQALFARACSRSGDGQASGVENVVSNPCEGITRGTLADVFAGAVQSAGSWARRTDEENPRPIEGSRT